MEQYALDLMPAGEATASSTATIVGAAITVRGGIMVSVVITVAKAHTAANMAGAVR